MGFFKFSFVAFALPSIVHALRPITCDSDGWLLGRGGSEGCAAVADEMNKVGTRDVECVSALHHVCVAFFLLFSLVALKILRSSTADSQHAHMIPVLLLRHNSPHVQRLFVRI